MKQTTRVNGKRVVITTSAKGKVTIKPADPLEWELQAAQVRALRKLPEYGRRFLLAGDMNAAKRGPRDRVRAVATGLTPGEPDLRIYGESGRLLLIENKAGREPLSKAQKERHADLARLGHPVTVIRADNDNEAAEKAVAAVRWFLSK